VLIGCPLASINKIREAAQLLSGKKVNSNVEVWVMTSHIVKSYAEKMGYVEPIEASERRLSLRSVLATSPRIPKRTGS